MIPRSTIIPRLRAITIPLLSLPFLILNLAVAEVSSPSVSLAQGGNGVPITINNFDDVYSIGYDVTEYFVGGDAHRFLYRPFTLKYNGKWDSI